MSDVFKISNSKITQTLARTKGQASGGKMTRLRCGGLSLEQEKLFSSKSEWSIAIGTSLGIIPTLYYVKPKAQGNNNQNSIKIRELKLTSPPHSKICPNFDRNKSIFEIINYYCPNWQIINKPQNRPSIAQEFQADFLMLEDKYSNRGLLVFLQPGSMFQLQTLTINGNAASSVLIESALNHLASLQLYENVGKFLERWQTFLEHSRVEKDIEQKRDDLERIGVECYFKAAGVDSPASRLTIWSTDRKIQFNIDIELKHDAKRFFNKKEASNIGKYPRLPILIIANIDTSKEPLHQQLLHPTISLHKFVSTLSSSKLSALPILRSAEEEIERLTRIVDQESLNVKILNKRKKKSKKVV
jgi:hypothetical protein